MPETATRGLLERRLGRAEEHIASGVGAFPRQLASTNGRRQLVGRLADFGVLTLIVVAVVAVYIGMETRPGPAAVALPSGLFVPDRVVGDAPVENVVCAAVELGSDALSTGSATIHWWTSTTPRCSRRDSSITTQPGDIRPVLLPAGGDLPERNAYRVSFVVGRIPSGTQEISFVLDPVYAKRAGLDLAGHRSGETQPGLTFIRTTFAGIPATDHRGPIATPLPADD